MVALTGGFTADYPRWSCEQLFALASDIESYPHFIPWCKSARILRDQGGLRDVVNHFGAGPVDMCFTSRALAEPPHRLSITAADGPFRRFRLDWSFTPLPQGGCRVRADYAMEFRSPWLQGLARLTVHEVERRVVHRFRDRARAVYGNG